MVLLAAKENTSIENVELLKEDEEGQLPSVSKVFVEDTLLELAANNDLEGFKASLARNGYNIDEVGLWYGRQIGGPQMVSAQRTPAMIAALYGSVDVLTHILETYRSSGISVNRTCGSDGSTILHCSAAGGSTKAAETVSLLLRYGADRETLDSHGRRPAEVITVSPKLPHVKAAVERLLRSGLSGPLSQLDVPATPPSSHSSRSLGSEDSPAFMPSSPASSPPRSPSGENSPPSLEDGSSESREFSTDQSLLDIKNSMYATDEFRMFSFKVRPCSRAYSHDWTECPFVHPGENARRRDPRRYHYSCVPCPDFRKGACRRGDACEYAHGVFESWLHPAQYRTRLCKDGTGCARRVCFFAHTSDELRPLYTATGSALPSPQSATPLDMRAMSLSPELPPPSPSSVLIMAPFSPSPGGSPSTPPMSPSATSASLAANMSPWPQQSQQSVPTLHLPGGLQTTSRLRAALHARDLAVQDEVDAYLGRQQRASLQIDDQRLAHELAQLSTQSRMTPPTPGSVGLSSPRPTRSGLGLQIPSHNMDDFYSAVDTPGTVGGAGLMPSPRKNPSLSASPGLHGPGSPRRSSITNEQLLQQLEALQKMSSPGMGSNNGVGGVGPGSGPIPMSPSSHAHAHSHSQQSALVAAMQARRAAVAARGSWRGEREGHFSPSMPMSPAPSPGPQLPHLGDWGSPTGKPDWGMALRQEDPNGYSSSGSSHNVRRSASLPLAPDVDVSELAWLHRAAQEAGSAASHEAAEAAMAAATGRGHPSGRSLGQGALSREKASALERLMAGVAMKNSHSNNSMWMDHQGL